jgi:hypothetical protein
MARDGEGGIRASALPAGRADATARRDDRFPENGLTPAPRRRPCAAPTLWPWPPVSLVSLTLVSSTWSGWVSFMARLRAAGEQGNEAGTRCP